MTRNERKALIRTIVLGLMLTLVVIVLDATTFGPVETLENNLYDFRARDCQFFNPPPTDRVVLLDIDDPSLHEIGSFPWPRTYFAQIVDEVHLAGAKVFGMDIMFPESQKPRWEPTNDDQTQFRKVDDDQVFAQACRNANNVLLPLSLSLTTTKRSELYLAMRKLLNENLEMDANEVAAKLRGSPLDSKNLQAQVHEEFLHAREEAMFDRVNAAMDQGIVDPPALREKLTPIAYKRDLRTDASNLLDQTLPRVQSVRNVLRFTVPLRSDLPPLAVADDEINITIPVLSDAVRYCGYVDFIRTKDGVVRTIPLYANYRGQLLPHMAMATACAILDVDLKQVQFTPGSVTLPLPTGEQIIIPVRPGTSPDLAAGMFMDIPWFGTKEYKNAFDPPNYQDSKQHIPLNTVWSICQLRRDIESLNSKVDEALSTIMQVFRSSVKKASSFVDLPPEQRTAEGRAEAIQDVLTEVGPLIDLSIYEKMKPSEMNQDEKLFVPAYTALIKAQKSLAINSERIQSARTALRSRLNGRAVVMGWSVTGGTDTYTTSLHTFCPGVAIQSFVVNAIVTRHLYTRAPWWQTALITFVIGVIVTLCVASFQPKQAMACTLGLMAAYFVINGIVLFDWGNRIYGVAGPLIVAPLVWFTLTLVRYISEQTQRRKITQRFQSYVDPKLVNFVLENIDDRTVFEGQVRLMTVVFTDLAGFTSISEKLRERTVGLLNDYMSLMLPIIRENNGVWNKFLGDGIMFFFGAPAVSPTHARDAIETVLQMQKALIPFNEQLIKDELPQVTMRAGISTGPMIVGDAGSRHVVHTAADYTVLGDDVNLGARLETANKYLGSKMLMNELAAQLCGEEFLLRPMGNICVAGKSEGVQCFEPLCKISEATEAHKRLAALSQQVVESFCLSQFDECLKAAEAAEAEFGSSKFTDLYQSLARLYMVEPPGEKFDGQIVLAEK